MVDGVITMNALASLPELTTLIGDAPWVQCAEYADAGNISCVGINDLDAAQGAVLSLAQSGRQRIALINHDLSYRYARLRERGYKSVLHVRDLSYQQVAYASDLSAAAGKAAMESLLAAKERPDAVFAVADSLAAGALRAIAQAGLRVPEDIAVIGFDGTELAEMVSPQLTTVEQPSRDIGRTAVTLLLKKIDNPTAEAERVMMDWRVITPRQYLRSGADTPGQRSNVVAGRRLVNAQAKLVDHGEDVVENIGLNALILRPYHGAG
ncbi:Catabolite control protein [Raoultella terrigena]|uniref:Catabolite control protein n=1 Tax=Raoultella terrigena TaxID=577 RepID=A0A4U9DAM7_RAOTE|nr:Catabolite control protein [Raoultella terrigena]